MGPSSIYKTAIYLTMKSLLVASFFALTLEAFAVGPLVKTTTGPIIGAEVAPGVLAWKGIPFGVPPTGSRRWTPPVLNHWNETKNTTTLGPACVQQLQPGDLSSVFYNTPPLSEDEDCLSINVWAPSKSSKEPKAVLFWIFGGGFEFGGSGTFFYDGTSFAKNQDVIIVSHNYRTNIFGFPNSLEITSKEQNLALLDQQLALSWTRDNIAKFGGDPNKITLFGQSAGSGSVSLLVEHYAHNPPFHAAILQSGVNNALSLSPPSSPPDGLTTWNSIADHFKCPSSSNSTNGTTQIDCLRGVPAVDLERFILDNDLEFRPLADGGTTIPNEPRQTLERGAVARVPIMIGDNAQGGSFLTVGQNNFSAFISQPPWNELPADELRSLYPVPTKFPSEAEAIVALQTDAQFRCPSAMFSDIFTNKSLSTVFRYVYGAVFPEFLIFPNAGTTEGTELPLVFGNTNGTTNATEIALSNTLQTIWANFAKRPTQPPVPHWPPYTPRNRAVAALAFDSNVSLANVVQVSNSSRFDGACALLDKLQA